VAGLLPDGRQIVLRACDECTNYKNFYGDQIPGHVLCERLASYVHLFNLYWSMRPFGVATLLAAHDATLGPQLYLVEPSGVAMVRGGRRCWRGLLPAGRLAAGLAAGGAGGLPLTRAMPRAPQRYYGTAVGKGRQAAKNEIEKLKLSEMTCRQAVMEAARVLHKVRRGRWPARCTAAPPPHTTLPRLGSTRARRFSIAGRRRPAPHHPLPARAQIHEEDGKQFELELSWLCEESGWQHARVPKDLQEEAERAAKAALEDSDMDDD
jgi:hypothetical protein